VADPLAHPTYWGRPGGAGVDGPCEMDLAIGPDASRVIAAPRKRSQIRRRPRAVRGPRSTFALGMVMTVVLIAGGSAAYLANTP
jgi:hypothetical protein